MVLQSFASRCIHGAQVVEEERFRNTATRVQLLLLQLVVLPDQPETL